MNEYGIRVNKRDIDYSRVGALLVVEDKIYVGHSHTDCIEFMLSSEEDSVISRVEEEIYNGTYSKRYAMCEISKKAVIVMDQDCIDVDLIKKTLLSYCEKIKYDLYVVPKVKDYNYLIKLN